MRWIKDAYKRIITGMISAMVGLMMVLFGGFQFSTTFKPVAGQSARLIVHGYLMDSYAMKAATQTRWAIISAMWIRFCTGVLLTCY